MNAAQITRGAKQARERFEALAAAYRKMKGVEGDVIASAPHDVYVAIMADAFHYAAAHGIDMMQAGVEAYLIFQEEGLE